MGGCQTCQNADGTEVGCQTCENTVGIEAEAEIQEQEDKIKALDTKDIKKAQTKEEDGMVGMTMMDINSIVDKTAKETAEMTSQDVEKKYQKKLLEVVKETAMRTAEETRQAVEKEYHQKSQEAVNEEKEGGEKEKMNDKGKMQSGDRVLVRGLTGRPDLNGAIGMVTQFDRQKRRWATMLDGHAQAMLFKEDNLCVVIEMGQRHPGDSDDEKDEHVRKLRK